MGGLPLHVVIPTAREHRNASLPYALATIAEHTEYVPVTVGHDTGRCDPHIPTQQFPGRDNVFRNTDLAMRTACETDWISDPFIWSADDIYWLRPAEPVRWALGKLEDTNSQATIYQKRKWYTWRILRAAGLPTFDYEAHVPMLVDKATMLRALTLGGDKRSVYGNLTGEPDLVAPDVKLQSRAAPLTEAPWVSTEGDPARHKELHARLLGQRMP